MTEKQIQYFLTNEVQFTFAKTMADIPHSWICKKDFPEEKFLNAMIFIESNGYIEKFFNREYVYYNIGEYKYWVMTDEKGIDDPTAIINKARI